MSWVACARGDPVIDWVTPPVWLQTQTENTPAWPGMTVTGQAWLATGKGGKVMVRLGLKQVELDENSLWEWAGKEDGSGGNTVQGRVREGPAPVRGQAFKNRSDDQSVRLHEGAPWRLVLDAGENQSVAEGLVLFLRNSGYPVSTAQKMQDVSGVKWQIWLAGFMSSEAAASIGANLVALAPGISASAKRRPVN